MGIPMLCKCGGKLRHHEVKAGTQYICADCGRRWLDNRAVEDK